jgi:hypothetical protein
VQTFSLIPYPAGNLPKIEITGGINRADNQLSIRYEISGEVDSISFPDPSASLSRKDDLWKTTCFEFFLAVPNQPQYWEFNVSPSGDWNIYKMDAYRRVGFREEISIKQLAFQFELPDLELSVDLNPLFPSTQPLQIGITAIIQTKDGNETYWALAHPGPQADFHLRESFILFM